MKKLLFLLALLAPTIAHAWEPPKTITAVIGNQPGAGGELSFRKLAQIVEQNNPKVNFIVENKPGADAAVAMNYFTLLPANGQTIALPSYMNVVTNDIWQAKVKKFDYLQFENVITLGKSPLLIVANAKSTIRNYDQLAQYLANPKQNVSIAIGGGAHRALYELVMVRTRGSDRVKHVTFNGPAQALQSVLSYDPKMDSTEFAVVPLTIAQPHIESGAVVSVAVAGDYALPGVSVIPNAPVYAGWYISLPPGTDKQIVAWFNREFKRAIETKDFQDWAKTNLVYIDPNDLAPEGVNNSLKNVKTVLWPVLKDVVGE